MTILISALDWGLGHATRCIPVIRSLLRNGCGVVIAGDGYQQHLLRMEFPELEFVTLRGYRIVYGKKHMLTGLILQLPRFFRSIKNEHSELKKIINTYKVDAVISDNRYGLYHKSVPCVLITHQLQVSIPGKMNFFTSLARKRIYRFINRFNECWVPDLAEETQSLAGILSHPPVLPAVTLRYLGLLSRFHKKAVTSKTYKLAISLSGPEPQRTILENIVLSQVNDVKAPVLLVRGMPGATSLPAVPEHVTVKNHLPAREMEAALLASEYILCRAGYSSIMDMETLGCKCIFVPTPGQTEQEYLAKRLALRKKALVKVQQQLNLHSLLAEAEDFEFFEQVRSSDSLDEIIKQWLKH